MANNDLVRRIQAECALALTRRGFATKSGRVFVNINDDFVGWIGLNAGRYADFVRINPSVGIHCPAIMKMTAAARSKKYRPNDTATYASPLLEFSPATPNFIFCTSGDFSGEACRLADCVVQVGLPFMESLATYAALLPLLEERVGNLGGYPQRYAAALILSGNGKGALQFIAQESINLSAAGLVDEARDLEFIRQTVL